MSSATRFFKKADPPKQSYDLQKQQRSSGERQSAPAHRSYVNSKNNNFRGVPRTPTSNAGLSNDTQSWRASDDAASVDVGVNEKPRAVTQRIPIVQQVTTGTTVPTTATTETSTVNWYDDNDDDNDDESVAPSEPEKEQKQEYYSTADRDYFSRVNYPLLTWSNRRDGGPKWYYAAMGHHIFYQSQTPFWESIDNGFGKVKHNKTNEKFPHHGFGKKKNN